MKKTIQQIASQFGYKIARVTEASKTPEISDYPCIDLLDLVVQDYLRKHQDIFFIQIGAHDGISADPVARQIRKYHWRGILVEPQPRAFKQLVQNYQGEDQLIFEQAAIGAQDCTKTFYTVREDPGLPFWLPQSASFDREWVHGALYYWKNVRKLDSIPDDFDSLIEEIPVAETTMATLLSKHNVEKLDVLAMATPGYDFEIMKMFPFDRIKPSIICFEYFSIKEREACLKYLESLGYSVGRFAARAVASLDAPTLRWTISEY